MTRLGALVLCGGRSKRMGRPKALLPFGGEPLAARVARILRERVDLVVMVAAEGQTLPPLPTGCRVVVDDRPGLGPLQGLATGFAAVRDEVEFAYATSIDVPFLNPAWIDRLLSLIGDHDLVMPKVEGFHHPLAALYRPAEVLPRAEALLAADRLRPFFLLESGRPRIVEEEELRDVDPSFDVLRNLNTPEDYFRALERIGAGAPSVTIELFGAARLKAGFALHRCRARFVSEALASLSIAAPALASAIGDPATRERAYKLNLNGDRFVDEEAMLVEGDSVLLFSADVGG